MTKRKKNENKRAKAKKSLGLESLPDIKHLSLLSSKRFCASSLRKLEWGEKMKWGKAEIVI